ncbi:MAG TPA: orotidine-5'-phosphate decarboxylase [Gammaproteobacteria bacterium]|jgi:uridine monophosphate synthetase|nr:orotidine-5'-phosphate decarboxylase [Gammaproteobacteria bacterium]
MISMSYQQRAKSCPSIAGKKLLNLMDSKKTNLALSADVTTADELLQIAELVGPEICLLKTHIDIINNYTPELTRQLVNLAAQLEFMIFEDRKFADIGNTVKLQYEGGVYKIVEWADFTNAHSLPGPGIIEGLAVAGRKHHRGIFMLAEMSSTGNLLDKDYVEATLNMAQQFPDFVAGFITQHALTSDTHWINLTPGIKFEKGIDALGQQYNTPETAILENGTDIIIVGRGIIEAKNPVAEAKLYRHRAWDAYCKRIG